MKRFSCMFLLLAVSCLFCGAVYGADAGIDTLLREIDIEAAQKAIDDIAVSFGESYEGEYPARLIEYKKRFAEIRAAVEGGDYDRGEAERSLLEIRDFVGDALKANPLLKGSAILFVTRQQYLTDHHNTATMFQTGEINTNSYHGGGALKVLDLSGKEAEVRTLLDAGGEGVVRDPEVYFDGGKIIFSMRKSIEDNYHIYEIKSDGGGLKQLTCASGVFDIDPVYLPDDSIVFTSSREPKYCGCNRHIMGNLFKMEADGANIHQIGRNTLFEGHSSLLPDGRILYDRWEYVDRNFGDAQGLWTVNPDGTNHAIYWGNNISTPGGVIDARPIAGTEWVVCIFGSCHDRPWGAMVILDRRMGIDSRDAVIRIWPERAIEPVGRGNYDSMMQYNPKYEDPYPLSEKYFLVSRMTGFGEQMGIYLVDVFGNEVLLHCEEGVGCFDPMLLTARKREPVMVNARDYNNGAGKLYVQNVYEGTGMEKVKRGAVKYLRVVESPEKRSWSNEAWGGQGVHPPAMNWHNFENKRILGTVPVEEDGSAYFEVPGDKFVFFQLLDADGMMIQSMRSGTFIQSGELQGCIGCHEDRIKAVSQGAGKLLATKRGASKLEGWYGEPRLFNYRKEVQPVFDKNCIGCHDFGGKGAKKLVLAGDTELCFNASYIELWRKGYTGGIGAGPAAIQAAYSWGSHKSKLVEVIGKGHNDVTLTKEEMDRIVTWVDINAPYYPDFVTAYPDNLATRTPITFEQLERLSKLTGVDLKNAQNFNRPFGPMVSFDRPLFSPVLAGLDVDSAQYKEAIKIIEAGKKNLQEKPVCGMDGFVPCEIDRNRLAFYEHRKHIENQNRLAIRRGRKVYDSDFDKLN